MKNQLGYALRAFGPGAQANVVLPLLLIAARRKSSRSRSWAQFEFQGRTSCNRKIHNQ